MSRKEIELYNLDAGPRAYISGRRATCRRDLVVASDLRHPKGQQFGAGCTATGTVARYPRQSYPPPFNLQRRAQVCINETLLPAAAPTGNGLGADGGYRVSTSCPIEMREGTSEMNWQVEGQIFIALFAFGWRLIGFSRSRFR